MIIVACPELSGFAWLSLSTSAADIPKFWSFFLAIPAKLFPLADGAEPSLAISRPLVAARFIAWRYSSLATAKSGLKKLTRAWP